MIFKRLVKRYDDRWPGVFANIEALKGQSLTAAHEESWAWELHLADLQTWKDQLPQFLESYTSGDALALIVAGGERGVIDTQNRLADKGHSLRLDHVNELR